MLRESEDQPHLVDGLDQGSCALGGLTRDWRFDRMATVIGPSTGKVSASFAGVAKHYGVQVRPCPPRRGSRKGVVEKANHVAAQRFWRTVPDDVTVEQAQARLDDCCSRRGDTPIRVTADGKSTVAAVAAREMLRPVPINPFPATLTVERSASAAAGGCGGGQSCWVAGYPASSARSPASIFAAASSCMPGITWLYVSSVMPMLA